MSHTLFAKPKNTLPQHLPPFYAQSVMRLSFFFTLRQTPPLFLIQSAAISLSLNTRRCCAISLSLNTLRPAGYRRQAIRPHYAAISLSLNTRRCCAISLPLNTRSPGWAIAGRRYAQLARLCARRCWRLARIRRALPSGYCPVRNLAQKRRNPPNGRGSL